MTADDVLSAIRENPQLLVDIQAGLRDTPPKGMTPIKIAGTWEFWPHPSNGGVWSRRLVNGRFPFRGSEIKLRAFMHWDAGEPSDFGVACTAGRLSTQVLGGLHLMKHFIGTMKDADLQSLELSGIVTEAKAKVDTYLVENGWLLQ